jgi:uncharacterized protein YneF (UPF0154 family)
VIVKAASAIWSVLSILIGVLVGAFVSDRIQRKRENTNSKKEEYRELLSTLTQAATKIADFHGPDDAHSPDEERAYYEAKEKALIVIDNRLFITREIEKIDLRGRWISAVHDVENGGHSLEFRRTVRQMMRQIISAGKHLIE